MGKFVSIVLVLLSVALGAIFGWYRAGSPSLRRASSGPAPAPVAPSSDPGTLLPGTIPLFPGAGIPGTDPSSALLRANAHFQDLQFEEARRAYAESAKSGSGADRRAERMQVLSDIFERATRGVPRSSADAPHELVLSNDRVLVGHVKTDRSGNVTLTTDQGISATFTPDEVVSVERVETSAWRASREAELKRRLDRVGRNLPPALDYYQAAYFCIRNGLLDLAPDLLLKSADSKGFRMVIETFGGEDSADLLARWEEVTRPAAPRRPTRRRAEPADEIRRAERFYQEGLVHYRLSLPGMEGAQVELDRARALFQKAQTAFEKAKESRPDDGTLDSRLQAVQTLLYDCIKRASL